MPTVVPDQIASRPLRPEPSAARARANEPSGAFDAMLDTRPAETPRPERPARADRPARPERARDAAPKEQTQSRAERAPDAEPQHTAEPAKPADAPTTRQAKNGQLSEPAGAAPVVDGEAAQTEAVAQVVVALDAVVVEAALLEAAGDSATPPADETETPVVAKPLTQDGDEAPAIVADTKPAEVPQPVVIAAAVAVVVPPQAAPAPASEPKPDSDIAAGASAPAPVAAADPAAAEASAAPAAAPVDGKDKTPKFAVPEPGIDPDAASDTPKPAAKDAAAAPEAKPLAEKAETDKPKPGPLTGDQHGSIKHAAADTPAPVNNRVSPADAPADAAKAAQQPRTPSAEPAAARSIAADARTDARVDTLAPQAGAPANVPGNAPIIPFHLALSSSLVAPTLPHALRLDPGADTPVPLAGVAVEIVARAQDGLKRFDIRLDPPELGRIDVRLDVDHGGKVTSRLIVERAETLDLLRRDAPQLERALQQAGLNTEGGMQFSLRDQNFAGRDQTRDNANTSHLIVPEDDTAAADAARRGYGRLIGLGGGIDIRV